MQQTSGLLSRRHEPKIENIKRVPPMVLAFLALRHCATERKQNDAVVNVRHESQPALPTGITVVSR